MALFERVRARKVLVKRVRRSAPSAARRARPSYRALVAARALGGLGWGCFAAVHVRPIPRRRGGAVPAPLWSRDVACLLGGILCGFAIGSAVSAPWTRLFLVEAGLMALRGRLRCLRARRDHGRGPRPSRRAPARRRGAASDVASSARCWRQPVVALTVGGRVRLLGTVGFVLYFINRQVAAREAPAVADLAADDGGVAPSSSRRPSPATWWAPTAWKSGLAATLASRRAPTQPFVSRRPRRRRQRRAAAAGGVGPALALHRALLGLFVLRRAAVMGDQRRDCWRRARLPTPRRSRPGSVRGAEQR